MATSTSQTRKPAAKPVRPNGKAASASTTNGRHKTARRAAPNRMKFVRELEVPSWATTVASIVGVSAAIGIGLFATRKQWLPQAERWAEGFSAAHADDETDPENFDQTRHAGRDSMRDDPGEDWEDVDESSDASFPASDPPSFNPALPDIALP